MEGLFDLLGLGGLTGGASAQAYQNAANAQNAAAALQQQSLYSAFGNMAANLAASKARSETIEEWCGRLQRAVERYGDDPMPYEEYARWRDELDEWKRKVGTV